jgi:glycine/D-amino acid oxidase-like deaminating enzyme
VLRPGATLVIGGGIVGLCAALAIQDRGGVVAIWDAPAERPPASWGNAGHIAVEQYEPLASWATVRSLPRRLMAFGGPASFPLSSIAQWAPFGLRLLRAATPAGFARGREALDELLGEALPAWRRLTQTIGAPELLRESGHIVAWESAAGARRGRAELAGFASPYARWRDLTADDAALLAGALKRPPVDGVRFEGTASLADPGATLDALRATFLRRGGVIEARAATLAEGRRLGADAVVVAAGARSGPLMREIGSPAPLIAERGYHIQSPAPGWPEALPPVVFTERALVATRFRSGLRATSFVEFSTADAPPDARKWTILQRHAAELGLPFDSQPQTWFGSRPTLPDYLPAIGQSRRDPRVFYAFGHQHLGLTLGPITGEVVAALACGDQPSVSAAPYEIERFA